MQIAFPVDLYTLDHDDPETQRLVAKLHTCMDLMCAAGDAWKAMATYDLCVKRTPLTGLGVYNGRRKVIPPDTLVALYPGRLVQGPVSDDYAIALQDTPYVVVGSQKWRPCADEDETILPVNAALFNHSCENWNCYTVTVQPPNCMPFVAVYTSRRVRAGEQLRYNYQDGYWTTAEEGSPCLCGGRNGCPKRLFKAM